MQKLLSKGIGHKKFKKIKWLYGKEIEIPEEWESKPLNLLTDIKGRIGWRGYTVNDLTDFGPLVIGATQITLEHRLDLSKPVFLSQEKYVESPEIQIQKNNILIVKTGNTIGKTALIDKNIGESTINPNVCLLKNIKLNSTFLYFSLLTNWIQYLLKIYGMESSAQPAINQKTIGSLIIRFPTSLEEQEKIVTILSNMDSQIQSQTQYKEKLVRLKKSLMQKLLTGEVRIKI